MRSSPGKASRFLGRAAGVFNLITSSTSCQLDRDTADDHRPRGRPPAFPSAARRGGMSVSDGVLGTRWSGTGLGRGRPRSAAAPSSRRAGNGSSAPFTYTHSGAPSTVACSTSRAVDSVSNTPPGGATDSIRCANPTCSPTAVYPVGPEPISPAITRPEFSPTRSRSTTPSRRCTSPASCAICSWMSRAAKQAEKRDPPTRLARRTPP
jgi:hypothetical protein